MWASYSTSAAWHTVVAGRQVATVVAGRQVADKIGAANTVATQPHLPNLRLKHNQRTDVTPSGTSYPRLHKSDLWNPTK